MIIDSEPKLSTTNWGFLPSEVKNDRQANAVRKMYVSLNAKCEKHKTSQLYKEAFLWNHCIIPSTGFFESRHYRPKGRTAEQRFPYYVAPSKSKYFLFAGIYQKTIFRETNTCQFTFAIVTRKANALMSQIHNNPANPGRMPLILSSEMKESWLSCNNNSMLDLFEYELPSSEMQAWPVRREFKTIDNPTEEFKYKDLPELEE